jgi:hypothetical protein
LILSFLSFLKKTTLALCLVFFAALPAQADLWPRESMTLTNPIYNQETGKTSYRVESIHCFSSFEEHKAYTEENNLTLYTSFASPDGQGTGLVFRNEDDTYREVYKVFLGEGCLKAVGFQEEGT